MKNIIFIISLLSLISCQDKTTTKKTSKMETKEFVWEGANIYFLLTDRFNNGDTTNDINFDRTKKTGKLRGLEGGDIKGITKKN
jgi:alpha-amylase